MDLSLKATMSTDLEKFILKTPGLRVLITVPSQIKLPGFQWIVYVRSFKNLSDWNYRRDVFFKGWIYCV